MTSVGQIGWRKARSAVAGPATARSTGTAEQSGYWRLVSRLTYLITALYALTFATLSVRTHDSFGTNAFDLGNMAQAVWSTLHGDLFHFTNWPGGTTRLAAHVEPILLLVAQFYRISEDPRTLLVVQSIVLATGALPAFWLARDRLKHEFAAVAFAAAYLLYPGLEAANLAEFHAVALSSSFLLFAFYFITRQRYGLFFVFAVLAMSTKEQVPLAVFLMGLYISLIQRQTRIGTVASVVALFWFVIAVWVIIPANNPTGASPYLSRYDQLGAEPGEILRQFFTNPGGILAIVQEPPRLAYLDGLFRPVAYLALLSPITLVMALPDIILNVLSNFAWTYSGGAHYDAVIVPFMIISAIEGTRYIASMLGFISQGVRLVGLYLVAGAVLISSVVSYYHVVFLPLTEHLPEITPHHRLAAQFIELIPPDAGVSASSSLNPHVAHRKRLYLFPDIKDADYIFLDASASPHPIDSPNQRYRVEQLLNDNWGIVKAEDGYLLLRRGQTTKEIPDGFYSFARATDPEPQQRLDVTFGDTVRLLGYDLVAGPVVHGLDAHARAVFYWQTLRPIDRDLQIAIKLSYPGGQQRTWWASAAATSWYPTSRWAPGEVVRVEVARLPLEGNQSAEATLAVVDGKNLDDPDERLRPSVPDGTQVQIVGDGTMIYLFKIVRG